MSNDRSNSEADGSRVFSGELNPDPESAVADLRRAGYEVFMMPDKAPASSFSLSVGSREAVLAAKQRPAQRVCGGPSSSFELSGQRRDTPISLGAREVGLKCV